MQSCAFPQNLTSKREYTHINNYNMPLTCSAPNCRTKQAKNGVRLFIFPKDENRKRLWIANCRRKYWTPKPSSRLCELHFDEDQFEMKRVDGWKRLKWNAIPTLFKKINDTENSPGVNKITKRNINENESDNSPLKTEVKLVKLEKLDYHFASTSREQSNSSHENEENTEDIEQPLLPTIVVKVENSENSQLFYDEANLELNYENSLEIEPPKIKITKINENHLLAKENAWLRTENLKLLNELVNQRQLRNEAESEAIRLRRMNGKLIDKMESLHGTEVLQGFLTEYKEGLQTSKENIKKCFVNRIKDKNTKFQEWHEYLMKKAINDVMTNKRGMRNAAKVYKVSKSTLSNKIIQLKNGEEINLKLHVGGGLYPTFDETLELRLVEHISQLQNPLTKWEFKALAFNLAEKLNINHSFNKHRRSAGENFYKAFRHRHPDVVFRFRTKVA